MEEQNTSNKKWLLNYNRYSKSYMTVTNFRDQIYKEQKNVILLLDMQKFIRSRDQEKDLNIVHIFKDISTMVAHRLVPLAM